MKNEMKLNNKGFSLVELIVVIAIMAILVGVLAPSVLGQLDKAKASKDKQAVDAIATAVAIAWADPDLTSKPSVAAGATTDIAGSCGITVTTSGSNVAFSGSAVSTFQDSVQATVGYTTVVFESNMFSSATTLVVNMNAVTGKCEVQVTDGTNVIYSVTK